MLSATSRNRDCPSAGDPEDLVTANQIGNLLVACQNRGDMAGVFEVYVKTHFSAAHSLKGYPGDCARMHGHNWTVEVFVGCKELDEIGIGVDFKKIEQAVKDVLEGLDHFNLNELPAFKDLNPSSENIARFLYKELGEKLNSKIVKVSRVRVCETPGAGASYWEE